MTEITREDIEKIMQRLDELIKIMQRYAASLSTYNTEVKAMNDHTSEVEKEVGNIISFVKNLTPKKGVN